MRFTAGSFALTLFVGFLAGIGPISTDMYLPALPAMAAYFGASIAEVQVTLIVYLFGYSLGQIIYGPISDRIGRRSVLSVGLLVYAAISLLSVFSPSIEWLMAARFIQAFAAAAPIVLGRAIIRDLYAGDEARRQISIVVGMMGIMPMVAPMIGSLLQVAFGWQAIFVGFAVVGGIALLLVRLSLPETLKQRIAEPFSVGDLIGSFAEIVRHPAFQANVAILACIYAGMFVYFVGSPFILQQRYGFSEFQYGIAFGSSAVIYILSSLAGGRLTRIFGGEWVFGLGTAILAVGGVGVLIGALLGDLHFMTLLLPISVYMVGVGFAFPQSIAGGLMPFPHRAGTASSLIGFFQTTGAAFVVLAISAVAAGSQMASGIVMAALGLTILALYLSTRTVRRAARALHH